MRQSAIAFAVLAAGLSPLSARAQAMPDRYGPTDPMAIGRRGAQTTLLSWTGKVDALRGSQSASDGLRGPELLDTSTGQAVGSANGLRTLPTQAAPQPQPAQRLASARLPASLYDNGGGVYAPPQGRPTQPVQSQSLTPAAPAQAAQQAQSAQAGTQAASSDAQTPRYYSLHREYGLNPDPVPQAQSSVLALSPAVAEAMATPPDNSPTIDLAGEDQAAVAPPPRLRNPTTGATSPSSSTSSSGTTTSNYTFNNP